MPQGECWSQAEILYLQNKQSVYTELGTQQELVKGSLGGQYKRCIVPFTHAHIHTYIHYTLLTFLDPERVMDLKFLAL